ncbi:Peptidase family C25 [Roseateles sp. YR242]|uniref:C25 family cysteine peptidase n=1 Tax=Roseateles sp. YR242 TaxID=1855305 RepID=UPI0008B33BEA|nr:C25 family cysteine peptidase [Roseateles sp. YR242]SEK67229.1 Peptidase family C25 [Roseateles sp. YR242]
MDKYIVLHRGSLRAKYRAEGLARIEAALQQLVAADRRRGVETQLLAIDMSTPMKAIGATPVPEHPDARQLKRAIDALVTARAPHYIVLLGGPDVLPMVPLRNAAHGGDLGDSDPAVPSDLPYACDAAYSTDPNRFLGPTRVVGRLPDLAGSHKPDLLLRLIRAAARHKALPREDYLESFSLSAEVWQASTRQSLTNTFGHADHLHLSPPEGPRWTKADLAPRMHFINCHGQKDMPEYYGQQGEDFPVSHRSALIRDRISAGTVIAAECCYGAQLFDPALADGQWPMALRYLADGATAFLGSTTIAYGPSEGNGSADLLCQYFLQRVLAGASTGRALLEARQKFAGERTHLDPMDLKTLGQFYLLGDPSLQPVCFVSHALARTRAFRKAFASVQDRGVRGLRREKLEREGRYLARALPRLKSSELSPSRTVLSAIEPMLRESGLKAASCSRISYVVDGAPGQRLIHVYKGWNAGRLLALIVTEQDGSLLHVRRMHAR